MTLIKFRFKKNDYEIDSSIIEHIKKLKHHINDNINVITDIFNNHEEFELLIKYYTYWYSDEKLAMLEKERKIDIKDQKQTKTVIKKKALKDVKTKIRSENPEEYVELEQSELEQKIEKDKKYFQKQLIKNEDYIPKLFQVHVTFPKYYLTSFDVMLFYKFIELDPLDSEITSIHLDKIYQFILCLERLEMQSIINKITIFLACLTKKYIQNLVF